MRRGTSSSKRLPSCVTACTRSRKRRWACNCPSKHDEADAAAFGPVTVVDDTRPISALKLDGQEQNRRALRLHGQYLPFTYCRGRISSARGARRVGATSSHRFGGNA